MKFKQDISKATDDFIELARQSRLGLQSLNQVELESLGHRLTDDAIEDNAVMKVTQDRIVQPQLYREISNQEYPTMLTMSGQHHNNKTQSQSNVKVKKSNQISESEITSQSILKTTKQVMRDKNQNQKQTNFAKDKKFVKIYMINARSRVDILKKYPKHAQDLLGYEAVCDHLCEQQVKSELTKIKPRLHWKDQFQILELPAPKDTDSSIIYLPTDRSAQNSSIQAWQQYYDRNFQKNVTIRKWHTSLFKEHDLGGKAYKYEFALNQKQTRNIMEMNPKQVHMSGVIFVQKKINFSYLESEGKFKQFELAWRGLLTDVVKQKQEELDLEEDEVLRTSTVQFQRRSTIYTNYQDQFESNYLTDTEKFVFYDQDLNDGNFNQLIIDEFFNEASRKASQILTTNSPVKSKSQKDSSSSFNSYSSGSMSFNITTQSDDKDIIESMGYILENNQLSKLPSRRQKSSDNQNQTKVRKKVGHRLRGLFQKNSAMIEKKSQIEYFQPLKLQPQSLQISANDLQQQINIISFITERDDNTNHAEIVDVDVTNAFKFDYILKSLKCQQKQLHSLTLFNCGLMDESLLQILSSMTQVCQELRRLDLSSNQLSPKVCLILNEFLRNPKQMPALVNLTLNDNLIRDEGIKELANGLMERFSSQFKNELMFEVNLPLQHLGISKTQLSDNGFKYLMQRFENMNRKIISHYLEIQDKMSLDFSFNNLTDSSVKVFANLLTKFQGIYSVDMRYLFPLKDHSSYQELSKALHQNQSLNYLDLTGNALTDENLFELLNSLSENYVLIELKLDVKVKHKKLWWETNRLPNSATQLQSMYEFFISKEQISL